MTSLARNIQSDDFIRQCDPSRGGNRAFCDALVANPFYGLPESPSVAAAQWDHVTVELREGTGGPLPSASRNRSTSIAAMHPASEAVMACR